MNRWDVINFFIEKNRYKTYLEIGYYKGWSFDRVICEAKTAVDPEPSKNLSQEREKRGAIIEDEFGMIFKMTSDEFFFAKEVTDGRLRLAHERNHLLYEPRKYDIVFIDGLHQFGQVMKDIQKAAANLSPGGVIIMHDCNPPKYEHTTNGIDGCWTGDTYKAAIEAQNMFAIDFYTIDTDWGVGVLKPLDTGPEITLERANLLRNYDNTWDYFDKNRKELLNLIDITTFLARERTYKVSIL